MLPAPDLDDRRFQDLVDEAKRRIHQRCPEWTDHNVSDPGVTLIELFAWMTDQLVYRLNRVPERNYVKFLELVGVRLQPATAARGGVTFWFSGAATEPVQVPAGTEVATAVAEFEQPIRFTTTRAALAAPVELESVKVDVGDDAFYDRTDELRSGVGFGAFGSEPAPGQALLLGLDDPAPGCAVRVRVDCRVDGVGVDPTDPPLAWEAWTGERWQVCDVEEDGTEGLTTRGDVVLHLPGDHAASMVERQRAGWIRCRIVTAREDQRQYVTSPTVVRIQVATIGVTVPCVNARIVRDEILGLSEGVAGQQFELEQRPVLGGDRPLELEVAAGDGWEPWVQVDGFADHGADDAIFVLDAVAGEVTFGPGVRLADGTVRQYGKVPPQGAPIRVRSYRVGGGADGNLARGTLTQPTSTLPSIHSVVNRAAMTGGVDHEPLADAMQRGPLQLRTRNRAVTVEDYELLARDAAPEVARVRCIRDPEEAGGVQVLVVPELAAPSFPFEDVVPADEVLARISAHLDRRRTIGARVVVKPPMYQPVAIRAHVLTEPHYDPERVRRRAIEALHLHLHPTRGGRDGTGWPFGRPLNLGEVFGVLQAIRGVELVERAELFEADPESDARSQPLDRVELDGSALLFAVELAVTAEPV